jgi:WS/DGAT/MGAT family acyltransferase
MTQTDRAKATAAQRARGAVPVPVNLPRRMTATDALFWYAESALPIFRPIIAGLYLLDRVPNPKRLERGLQNALVLIPRLRQRVVEAPLHVGLPEWADDAHFDPGYHARHLSLPQPGSQRQLLDLVATLFATPLDRERPLWEAYWIDGLANGRSAYFFKLHHSVVDGVGAIALLNALTQPSRDAAIPRLAAVPGRTGTDGNSLAQLAGLAVDNAAAAAQLVRPAAAPAGFVSADALVAWQATARGIRGCSPSLPTGQPRSVGGGSSGLSRRFDIMPIPLGRLRAVTEPLGVTINDLVLASWPARWAHITASAVFASPPLNCMVPMNLRGG